MWSKIKQDNLCKGFSMQQVSLSEAQSKAISKVVHLQLLALGCYT